MSFSPRLTPAEQRQQEEARHRQQAAMDRTAEQQAAVARQRQANADALAELERQQREEQQRRSDRLRAEREAELGITGAANLARLKDETREAFIASGGTAAEFDTAWPRLKQRILEDATLQQLAERRANVHRVRL